MENQSKFESWAIVELFGHSKIVGKVTEKTIAGAAFIQVDVPETARQPAFTRIFHPNAIYCLNPCTEEVGMRAASVQETSPIIPYDIRADIRRKVRHEIEMEKRPALPEAEVDGGGSTFGYYDEDLDKNF